MVGGLFRHGICEIRMDICKNKLYIEKVAQEISLEELKEDIRVGCLKCSGYEICADNTEQDLNLVCAPEKFVKFK